MAKNKSTAFGNYLRGLRNANDMTLKDLERASGISCTYICSMEKGNPYNMSEEKIAKLAEIFNVPVARLYLASGRLPPKELDAVLSARKVLSGEELLYAVKEAVDAKKNAR